MARCRVCNETFEPTTHQIRKSDWICLPCRRISESAWRKRRKAAGRPVQSTKLPREWHSDYEAGYRKDETVRARLAERSRRRRRNPNERPKIEARWLLRRAVSAGRVFRQPCEVCGNPRSQGHHEDYSRPLDVVWLCPIHHAARHAKAEGAQE